MTNIELTKAEAKEFKNGHGMYAVVLARKLRQRARSQANETGEACQLTYRDETLFMAAPVSIDFKKIE